jgi:4-amino-4-deoxy-L-arabinose transferase-like glycosyltransferase
MPFIQESIHKLEVAGGLRPLKVALSILAVLALAALYNFRAYHNMSNQEAMDAAQLARNIARGKGYTTDFIRPFSMFLLKKNNEHELASGARLSELAMIKGGHPDIANPPAYPVLLAGLMKILPFDFSMPLIRGFWSTSGFFLRFQPEFIITIFNELLFLGSTAVLFFLARRLFDPITAWLSAGIFFGTETFWRFSISGLSTMLLVLIFLGLAWTLLLIEEQSRDAASRKLWMVLLAIGAGLLVGVGFLTRYSFGWLIIPVIIFLLLFTGARKAALVSAAFIAFALVAAPWIARNYNVSDTPFGTTGYAIYQDSGLFPEDMLERSLNPDFNRGRINAVTQKFLVNSRQIVQEQVPKLGGNWLGAFFIVGLMVGFANAAATRLRYFLLFSLIVFVVAQALGRTYLSTDSPDINSENLLVLLAPLTLIFAVSFFVLLLNQVYLPLRELRYVVIVLFVLAGCFPTLYTFLPPGRSPLAPPPYRPHTARVIGTWLKDREMAGSDLPWAVAWYGQRRCLWLPRDQPQFEDINLYYYPINLVYLTERSTEHLASSWSLIALESLNNRAPPDFPLQHIPPRQTENPADLQGLQVILTDMDRW